MPWIGGCTYRYVRRCDGAGGLSIAALQHNTTMKGMIRTDEIIATIMSRTMDRISVISDETVGEEGHGTRDRTDIIRNDTTIIAIATIATIAARCLSEGLYNPFLLPVHFPPTLQLLVPFIPLKEASSYH
eukprot:scaffold224233_cov35-Attheya_sp.AAC.2